MLRALVVFGLTASLAIYIGFIVHSVRWSARKRATMTHDEKDKADKELEEWLSIW